MIESTRRREDWRIHTWKIESFMTDIRNPMEASTNDDYAHNIRKQKWVCLKRGLITPQMVICYQKMNENHDSAIFSRGFPGLRFSDKPKSTFNCTPLIELLVTSYPLSATEWGWIPMRSQQDTEQDTEQRTLTTNGKLNGRENDDDIWWYMMIYGVTWWYMMIYGATWWYMMIYGDIWW